MLFGKLQGVAALSLAGDFYLNRQKFKYKEIRKVEPALVAKPYYLMLSHQFVKKYPKLSQDIWNALEEIRKDDIEKISNKYFE